MFVHQLATILANPENVPFVRQASGLQLKNTLDAKEANRREAYEKRWVEFMQALSAL